MSKNNKEAVIVEGFRTPFVKAGQDFQDMSAEELGAWVLRELLERTRIDLCEIEEVILGNIINPLDQPNIARAVVIKAGLPQHVFAQQIGVSPLESIFSSAAKIRSGFVNTMVIGGVESMSQAMIVPRPALTKIIKKVIQSKTWKEKIKHILSLRPHDIPLQFMDKTLFVSSISDFGSGQTVEFLPEYFHISRKEQDEFTLMSFQKACHAQKSGKWKEEIVPVFPPTDFGLVEKDTNLENIPSMHSLSELKPYFKGDYGTVTTGNSSFSSDGAALLLIMNKDRARALGYKPLVSIYSFARVGVDSREYSWGPVCAAKQALNQAHLKIKDIDLFEIDESFSAQALACLKSFESPGFTGNQYEQNSVLSKVSPEKCNVNGGALALGHPLSATHIRMILNLAKEMNRRKVEWGMLVSSICQGQAGAIILKNTLN